MPNKNTQEQAVLTFTKESNDIYKMIANFTPVNSLNNEVSVFHKHVLAIAAEVMGTTLLLANSGEIFVLSNTPIWVRPIAVALSLNSQVLEGV
ncbi:MULTISPECIES: hypothetical protein [Entomomonas]|uniref:Uncharacterized protein n=1 Tax=Entomomonas asaccharolytica TaxID=2785331 RepID=A0A974RYG9_9GAMM|nr:MULTISPECIES: hypothetical protein [Entomomonas]QQP87245.1 hypothetical protein JHT90_06085 [Entomomonas asaccharolytica]UYZ85590.1 hypothetical protein MTZ49_13370 [Entomomonas sp. E2T0]